MEILYNSVVLLLGQMCTKEQLRTKNSVYDFFISEFSSGSYALFLLPTFCPLLIDTVYKGENKVQSIGVKGKKRL